MKLKTKKIVAKRFKVTGTGKIMRMHQNSRHLRSHKSKQALRRFAKPVQVAKNIDSVIKSFIPYM